MIHNGLAYLFGAFGHLHCVELATGEIRWHKDIRKAFKVDDKLVWGTCSSPLIIEGKLIVNPGAKDAAVVALDPNNGATIWKCPGNLSSFSSFAAIQVGKVQQIVGYDANSLGGWNAATGERLWTLVPPKPRDFNVPTPIFWNGKVIATSENNGTRIYAFDNSGNLNARPLANNDDLAPDSHTPVVVGDRLFGVWKSLFCLDLKNGLMPIWESDDSAFGGYATLVASKNRVLCITQEGELILFDAGTSKFKPISRVKLFDDDRGVYSHPAIVGDRIVIRNTSGVVCLSLSN